MKSTLFFTLFLLSYSLFAQKAYKYPIAAKDSVTDEYHGVLVRDPYQWMENSNDPRLTEWVENQKQITKREVNRQTHVWDLRAQLASMYFDTRRTETDEYAEQNYKLKSKYYFKDKFTSTEKTPDLLYRREGESNYQYLVRIKDFRQSKHDNLFIKSSIVNEEEDLALITISRNGSDWVTGYFFDLRTGQQLPDTLKNIRGSSGLEWNKRGLFYDSYDNSEEEKNALKKARGQKLCYHSLGQPQSEDKVLFRNPDRSGTNPFYFSIHEDKLILHHFLKVKGTIYNALSVANTDPEAFLLNNFLVYPNGDNIQMNIELIQGDSVYIRSNWSAPNERVLLANFNLPNQISEIVPEYDVNLFEVNKLGKGKFACLYKKEGSYFTLIFSTKGELLKKIDFPKGKKLEYFYEYEDDVEVTNFCLESFYHPPLWYQISLDDLNFKPIESVSVPYDPNSLETRYVKYKSKDGIEVPMYITSRKDIKLNSKNPVLMYGYGGYGITVEPFFEESIGLWLLHGGVLAVPNIRGGGANGSDWALEGRGIKKQNAIDDFIEAAEFLIQEKYTSPQKLAINGESHGGMLVGAAITQRPELFKAAIAEAGLYDMLRKERFTVLSVNTNLNEFGQVSNYDDFINLKSYSPLHNLKPGVTYPNLLLITGDSDDRVPPLHSFKFLATMQEKGSPEALYHIYITPGSGHGGALTTEDWVNYTLYKYSFLFDQLSIDFY
ncbi:prolyl oligopeptidase family serine peptidase [Limibacter armeniacum]|uniref:prolyl oligopeptidase family serine peptidase n=1 Tax=Limibacter armeniacum TaxID=466084 RepID=UPI002FE594E8